MSLPNTEKTFDKIYDENLEKLSVGEMCLNIVKAVDTEPRTVRLSGEVAKSCVFFTITYWECFGNF